MLLAGSLAVLVCADGASLAETGPPAQPLPVTVGTETVGSVARLDTLDAERRKTAVDLANLADQIQLTEDAIRRLDGEIDTLASDREGIRSAMIEAAARQKAAAADIAATEGRIEKLGDDQAGIKLSLRERRGLLAEVLGALERMGRKPPPALLVRPDDALGSVRSAILLGAVVPGIRQETQKLVADLDRLSNVRRDIVAEKERFVAGLTRQHEEEARLSRLFGEKEKLEADHRGRREAEARRVADLAAKATTLQDLIETLEGEAKKARIAEAAEAKLAAERREAAVKIEAERQAALAAKAEEDARIAAAAPQPEVPQMSAETASGAPAAPAPGALQVAAPTPQPDVVAAPEPTYDIASLRRDMNRLEPGAPFSTMKGRLSKPVTGSQHVGYGQGDGIGRPSSGITLEARPGDLVTAPADGQVLYSGPFRSYGQLLILNAGDGYHVVLAGMSEIDVSVGQFVLSGEPVAVMGAKRVASAAAADFGPAETSLYVEFRKDGKPVDPSPWWTARPSGRTRNDS
jgi:septal ring factor EnvC (AmiA/AmiB activator)